MSAEPLSWIEWIAVVGFLGLGLSLVIYAYLVLWI
jgi:hypothetical protein